MHTKTRDSLHKILPGVVLHQLVTCGRANCRCARGQLHGPYFYRFYRANGRLRKEYVPAAELEKVRAGCNARRQAQQELRAGWGTWRQLRAAIRELEGT